MGDVVQLLIGQLRHKLLRAALAAEHIRKGNVLCFRVQFGRELCQDLRFDVLFLHRNVLIGNFTRMVDHALESGFRLDRHVLVQALNHMERIQRKFQHALGIAHVRAHFHAVNARLQHTAALVARRARIIVGSKVRKIHAQLQHFALAGL